MSGYILEALVETLCEREMGRTLKGPLFRREWSVIADDFAHDPELFAYLSTLIGSRQPNNAVDFSRVGEDRGALSNVWSHFQTSSVFQRSLR